MKTITLEKPKHFTFGETELPGKPSEGEALVRVRRVGICGTDIHAYRGDQPYFSYPRILGHELGVEISEIGPNDAGLNAGDLCAVEPYLDCGQCIACRRGKSNCCVNLKVLGVHTDGGMREFIRLPIRKLHRSKRLSADQLALIETLSIGAHAVERARLEANEWVLVIGAGPIGLGLIRFSQLAGARVIVLDVNDERLTFVHRHFGVKFTVQGREEPLKRLEKITGGELATAVFDATGNVRSMSGALQYVAHGGRLIFVGIVLADFSIYDPDFHRREATLLSSRNATSAEFPRIISLVEAGKVDPTLWATHRTSSAELVEKFPQWLEPGTGLLKGIIEF